MKRILALLLIASLSVFMVACGSKPKSDPSETPPTEEETPTEAPEEETPTEPVEEEENYDFGGMTVKMAWPWPPKYTEAGEETELFNARVAEVEEKLNIKFEWIGMDAGEYWDNMVTNTLAGDNYGNIMFSFPWYFPEWIKAGMVAEVEPIAESLGIDLNDPSWNRITREVTTFDGKQYAFDKFDKEVNSGLIFNKRLLEEAGLKSPYEHVENGTWNWETFEEYAKALTIVDADGTTTQWGLSSMEPYSIANMLILSNDATIVDISTGTPTVAADNEDTLEALALYQRMVSVDKTVRMGDPEDWESNVKAFAESNVAMMVAEQWIIDYINTMEPEEFGFVYFPQGPKATEYVSTAGYYMFWIPNNIPLEEQQAAFLAYSMIFDTLYPEIPTEEYYSIMGEKYVHDEEGAAIYSDIQTRDLFAPIIGERYGVDNKPLFDMLKSTEYTPQSAVAEQKPVMEAKIADFLNKN